MIQSPSYDHFGEIGFCTLALNHSGIFREIMAKEIAMYNRLNSIESLQNEDISTMVSTLTMFLDLER